MKKLFLLLAIICALLSTSSAQSASNNTIEDGKDKMKKTYFADFNFKGHFEIIFNGISLKRNSKNGVISGLEYLNPFIKKTGDQIITLNLKPLSGKIYPDEVKDYFIDIIYTDNGEASPINKVIRCSFPETEIPVDSLTYSWVFKADVPFEINTLDGALDLTEEDKQKLLEEVLLQYQYVQILLNEGKVNDYMLLYKKSREREMISMYYDENQQKEYLQGIEQRAQSSKGYMQSLTDYKLLLHPNNKIVSLVNIDGKTPLYSLDNEGKIKTYGLQLYRSSKTGKLEVY